MNIAERLHIARENIAERLEPLLEKAAEKLHPIREGIRFFMNLAINTDFIRHDSEKEARVFVDSLAVNQINGKALEKNTGVNMLWQIARQGTAWAELPLADKERVEFAEIASGYRQISKVRRISDIPELGLGGTDCSGARAAHYEHMSSTGKMQKFLVFDRKTRIVAGEKFLQLKPELVEKIAHDKRFPRPVRREAKAIVKQQKLMAMPK
ncbi:MAG: hypothetical protein NT051_02565 [Candidatus Micrarchaeota archaeon]|nr:hypothetical protein [Candidatus Micrarchaeota archaeon]